MNNFPFLLHSNHLIISRFCLFAIHRKNAAFLFHKIKKNHCNLLTVARTSKQVSLRKLLSWKCIGRKIVLFEYKHSWIILPIHLQHPHEQMQNLVEKVRHHMALWLVSCRLGQWSIVDCSVVTTPGAASLPGHSYYGR